MTNWPERVRNTTQMALDLTITLAIYTHGLIHYYLLQPHRNGRILTTANIVHQRPQFTNHG